MTGENDERKAAKQALHLQIERGKRRSVNHLAYHGFGPGSIVEVGGNTFTLGKFNRSNQCFARKSGSWMNPVELENALMENGTLHCTRDCDYLRPKFSDVVG